MSPVRRAPAPRCGTIKPARTRHPKPDSHPPNDHAVARCFARGYVYRLFPEDPLIPTSARTDSCLFTAGGKGDRAAPRMRRLADERSRVSVHGLTGIIDFRSCPSSKHSRWHRRTSESVKGCRTPAVAGRVARTRSAGAGEASGEATAGRDGRGGAAGYGDLPAWPLALMAASSERLR